MHSILRKTQVFSKKLDTYISNNKFITFVLALLLMELLHIALTSEDFLLKDTLDIVHHDLSDKDSGYGGGSDSEPDSGSESDSELDSISFDELQQLQRRIDEIIDQQRKIAKQADELTEDVEDVKEQISNDPCFNKNNCVDNGKNIRSPLDQFKIIILFSMFAPALGFAKLSVTNMGLFLTTSMYINWTVTCMIVVYNKLKINKWYAGFESIYTTIYSIVVNQINDKTGQIYYPFMYNIFTFILVNNLIGMIPYCFSSTSHFILGFLISFTVVIGCTILGIILHKTMFWSLFVPSGCPKGLLLLLVLIELISYLARNVSLGLRLAANILSGHMLLNILSGFTFDISKGNAPQSTTAVVPFAFIGAFTILEIGISFIQSQVFTVLGSSYIKDALFMHGDSTSTSPDSIQKESGPSGPSEPSGPSGHRGPNTK